MTPGRGHHAQSQLFRRRRFAFHYDQGRRYAAHLYCFRRRDFAFGPEGWAAHAESEQARSLIVTTFDIAHFWPWLWEFGAASSGGGIIVGEANTTAVWEVGGRVARGPDVVGFGGTA